MKKIKKLDSAPTQKLNGKHMKTWAFILETSQVSFTQKLEITKVCRQVQSYLLIPWNTHCEKIQGAYDGIRKYSTQHIEIYSSEYGEKCKLSNIISLDVTDTA